MRKVFIFCWFLFLNACTTDYILMDEEVAYDDVQEEVMVSENEFYAEDDALMAEDEGRLISANDVFVVGEGLDYVTYQYKNVRVDEISPLASMYCADVAFGGSPYLREVSIYHNGFMRATFDCVSLAI